MRELARTIRTAAVDVPKALYQMRSNQGWVRIQNRIDRIQFSDEPLGAKCNWKYSSDLDVCKRFPFMGRWILKNTLGSWTFNFSKAVEFDETPVISFIIPHRGKSREGLLHTTIRSIAAQCHQVECIVVEQDEKRNLGELPGNARHVLATHPEENHSWRKSLAFNVGAAHAKGKILVFHDGDIPVPAEYAYHILSRIGNEGYEVAFLQRFLFYLSKATSSQLLEHPGNNAIEQATPERVTQNWVGGTVAISRTAFQKIGGWDEDFVGWSGEDLEFHDRCQELNGWNFGYIPFVHLWHPPQEGKQCMRQRSEAVEFTRSKLNQSRKKRIDDLIQSATTKML
jgi:cellulose synthase/poly-beta-1,6-N-acetylglucosamine synthase-like glycosyltransferase